MTLFALGCLAGCLITYIGWPFMQAVRDVNEARYQAWLRGDDEDICGGKGE